MSKLDDELRARLNASDEEFLADLERGEGYFTQLFATFKGPQGWVGIMVMITVFVILAVSVWCLWEAFHATRDRDTILWTIGAVAGLIGQGILRLFLASRMHMLATMRALKQVELRLIKLEEGLNHK